MRRREPVPEVVAGDTARNRERVPAGLVAHVHRGVRDVDGAGLQLGDDAHELVEASFHRRPVLGEDGAREVGVPTRQDLGDACERDVERAQPEDDRGVGELVGGVAPVAGRGIDVRRHEDAGLVVRAQRLHRQRARSREHADGEQRVVHEAILVRQ